MSYDVFSYYQIVSEIINEIDDNKIKFNDYKDKLINAFDNLINEIQSFLIYSYDYYYGYFLINLKIHYRFQNQFVAAVTLSPGYPVLMINPITLGKMSLKCIIFVLCHEIEHLVLSHHIELLRMNQKADPKKQKKLNIAFDASVNDRININIENGLDFLEAPEGIITSQTLSSILNMEVLENQHFLYYYNLLKDSNTVDDTGEGSFQDIDMPLDFDEDDQLNNNTSPKLNNDHQDSNSNSSNTQSMNSQEISNSDENTSQDNQSTNGNSISSESTSDGSQSSESTSNGSQSSGSTGNGSLGNTSSQNSSESQNPGGSNSNQNQTDSEEDNGENDNNKGGNSSKMSIYGDPNNFSSSMHGFSKEFDNAFDDMTPTINSDLDIDIAEQILKNYIEKTLTSMSNKSRGLFEGLFFETIQKLKGKSIVPWKKELRKFIGNIPSGNKKTIMRLNRRQPQRLDLRGTIADKIIKIVIAIDTSASMSSRELAIILNEIAKIIKTKKTEITIIECDAKIHRIYKVKRISGIDCNLHGRGGTCFSPVIRFLNNDKYYRDSLLIYFTDGYGEFEIPKPLVYRTLWIVFGHRLSVSKPYGSKMFIDPVKLNVEGRE